MRNASTIGLIAVTLLNPSSSPARLLLPSPRLASYPTQKERGPQTAWAENADTVAGTRPASDSSVIVTADAQDDRSHWMRDFDRRSASNKLGYFLNEQQIQAAHPQYTSDALRRVPGIVVLPGRGIGNTVRIRGCAPLIWVDGQRAPGVELDEVTHGNDVAGLEVYRSLAGVPAEFTDRSATCGTILVWLKTG